MSSVKTTKTKKSITSIKTQSDAKKFASDMKNNCIILYYWNSCGHCHSFRPLWEELSLRYGNETPFYEIELKEMNVLFPEKYRKSSFPTIVGYNKTKELAYDKSRTLNDLSRFIEQEVKIKSAPTIINRTASSTPKTVPRPATPRPKAKTVPTKLRKTKTIK